MLVIFNYLIKEIKLNIAHLYFLIYSWIYETNGKYNIKKKKKILQVF